MPSLLAIPHAGHVFPARNVWDLNVDSLRISEKEVSIFVAIEGFAEQVAFNLPDDTRVFVRNPFDEAVFGGRFQTDSFKIVPFLIFDGHG